MTSERASHDIAVFPVQRRTISTSRDRLQYGREPRAAGSVPNELTGGCSMQQRGLRRRTSLGLLGVEVAIVDLLGER